VFTRTDTGSNADNVVPDVEIRLLNTLIGSSPETMSQFVQISNINVQVAELLLVLDLLEVTHTA